MLALLFSALTNKPSRRKLRRDVIKGLIFALGAIFILVSGVVALVELLGLAQGLLVSGITLVLVALAFPITKSIRQYFQPKPRSTAQNALMELVGKDPQTTLLLALSTSFLVAEAINKKHSN